MKRKLFTIGYTGFSATEFIGILKENEVECLLDTRELPISRKKGFAKTALASQLSEAGISYKHFRLLGSPRVHRHEVRATGDYDKFFAEVRRHIASVAGQQLREAIAIARQKTSCLMCCCPDWTLCHRRCVVEAINELTYFSIEHLARNNSPTILRRAA